MAVPRLSLDRGKGLTEMNSGYLRMSTWTILDRRQARNNIDLGDGGVVNQFQSLGVESAFLASKADCNYSPPIIATSYMYRY